MPTARDQDYYAWTREQAALLRGGTATAVAAADLDLLAEEIEEMGGRDLAAMESALTRILEHLLKWQFSPADWPRRGWRLSLIEHRMRLRRMVARSGSLRARLPELLPAAYADARKLAAVGLEEDGLDPGLLPATCPYPLANILDEDWVPHAGAGGRDARLLR